MNEHFNLDVAQRLGRVEEKVDGLREDLKPMVELVASHDRTLSRWDGVHQTLIWLLGAAATFFAGAYTRLKFWS